ncbi:MAG: signal peptidase I [Clostridia bacterium]|nr:signal peptidase I [Clostridia bacterium]
MYIVFFCAGGETVKRQIDIYYVIFPGCSGGFRSVVFDIIDSLKSSIIAVFLIFALVFRAVGVSGTSMVPTLRDGDWLAVTAVTPDLRHGDIVVVTQPWERGIPIIKRVIGLSGDKVDIDFENGFVYVNGEKLSEPYIAEPTREYYDVEFPLTVPDGYLFVMGDNRNVSLDSRSSKVGFADKRYVLGRAFFRLFKETGFIGREGK